MKIDIWSDVVCPFCYIGTTQFQKALDKFEHKDKVEIHYRSFQLSPEDSKVPSDKKGYEVLAAKKGISPEQMKASFMQVIESGKQEGLDMKMLDTVMVNTFDAHQLIHFATNNGKQHEAVDALYKAYFTETKNIADEDVLLSVVESIDLNRGEFKQALEAGEYKQAVTDDTETAAKFGIQGVPAFIADEKLGATGARGVEGFSHFLATAWQETHPIQMMDDSDAKVCKDDSC